MQQTLPEQNQSRWGRQQPLQGPGTPDTPKMQSGAGAAGSEKFLLRELLSFQNLKVGLEIQCSGCGGTPWNPVLGSLKQEDQKFKITPSCRKFGTSLEYMKPPRVAGSALKF